MRNWSAKRRSSSGSFDRSPSKAITMRAGESSVARRVLSARWISAGTFQCQCRYRYSLGSIEIGKMRPEAELRARAKTTVRP